MKGTFALYETEAPVHFPEWQQRRDVTFNFVAATVAWFQLVLLNGADEYDDERKREREKHSAIE